MTTLHLPPAPARPTGNRNKSEALRVAEAVPLQAGPATVGTWVDGASGRQTWRLALTSQGASSLSVRVVGLALPQGGELWACAPDASVSHGPYVEAGPAGSGQLWTPQVPGPVLILEVSVPSGGADGLGLELAEAYVGYR